MPQKVSFLNHSKAFQRITLHAVFFQFYHYFVNSVEMVIKSSGGPISTVVNISFHIKTIEDLINN